MEQKFCDVAKIYVSEEGSGGSTTLMANSCLVPGFYSDLFSVREEVPATKSTNEEPIDNIRQLLFSVGVSYGHVFFPICRQNWQS
jgi:hypothetical protein